MPVPFKRVPSLALLLGGVQSDVTKPTHTYAVGSGTMAPGSRSKDCLELFGVGPRVSHLLSVRAGSFSNSASGEFAVESGGRSSEGPTQLTAVWEAAISSDLCLWGIHAGFVSALPRFFMANAGNVVCLALSLIRRWQVKFVSPSTPFLRGVRVGTVSLAGSSGADDGRFFPFPSARANV